MALEALVVLEICGRTKPRGAGQGTPPQAAVVLQNLASEVYNACRLTLLTRVDCIKLL